MSETHTMTRTSYITVTDGVTAPVAAFTASPVSGTLPLSVTFANQSTDATSYVWSFGDGVTSTVESPVYTYTATGVYTVSLTATGAGGSDTLTRTNYVTVTAGGGGSYTTTTTVITYTYDPLNRLTGADYSDGTSYEYAYDEVGNREAMTTTSGTVTYTYDVANRLTSVGGVSYTYDNNGNLTSDDTYTYTWDTTGRLIGVESITTTIVYTYNGDGVRVAQSVDGVETRWAVDTDGLAQVLVETSAGTETIYLYGYARLAEVEDGDGEWFLGDALGSVRQVVDGDGAVVLARDYAPFGLVRSESGTGSSGYGFTGEQYAGYTQFVYLRARWMDLRSGRFISQDTWEGSIQQPSSLHKYLYVSANPVNLVDPTGKYECEDPDECKWGPPPPPLPPVPGTCIPEDRCPDPTMPGAVLNGSECREVRKTIILRAVVNHHGRFPTALMLAIATAESGPAYDNTVCATSANGEVHCHGVMGVTRHATGCYTGDYENTVNSLKQNVQDAACWLHNGAGVLANAEDSMNTAIKGAVKAAGYTDLTAHIVASAQWYSGKDKETYLRNLAGFVEVEVPREFGGYPDFFLANALGHGYEGYLKWKYD